MKIWHPFTQEKTSPLPIKIVKGEGVYIFDENSNKYIDAISSWWVNIHGHSNKEIAETIYEQASVLEHVIFAGYTHDPAERICKELCKFLPEKLRNFFFSDNGSTAVEVAIKMAYQYYKNIGRVGKNVLINLSGGYHGDTLGAMSAAGVTSSYHSMFSEFFFKTFSIDVPEFYNGRQCIETEEMESIQKLRCFLEKNAHNVYAIILEPLVQGAAGMRMYRKEFLEMIITEIRQYEILVIFDEVMTGFYRTGTMFAMNQLNTVPDIICLSKGITGGFLPLSLTIATNEIYESFLSEDWKKAFIHGHSYTANPISCAAACKSIEMLQRENVLKNIKSISDVYQKWTNVFNDFRSLGTIAAFKIKDPKHFQKAMLKNGIITRPINESMYIMPPYCISAADLECIFNSLCICGA